MDDELYDDDNDDDEVSEEFVDFLKDAIGEALRTEDGTAFLEWIREEAPERAPEIFDQLPDDQARRGFATELGRSLWNAVPLPGNGYKPRPIARPERNDPCLCGSGLKYKKCCSQWADAVPAFDTEGIWRFLIEDLPLEKVEELGQAGRVPGPWSAISPRLSSTTGTRCAPWPWCGRCSTARSGSTSATRRLWIRSSKPMTSWSCTRRSRSWWTGWRASSNPPCARCCGRAWSGPMPWRGRR